MHEVRKTQNVGYEDLMREMSIIEQHLLIENRDLAMRMMVLEAKMRERFQNLEFRVIRSDPSYQNPFHAEEEGELTTELNMLIPQELPPFPTIDDFEDEPKKKKMLETAGLAALLAVVTALGVFGLASILHLALSWLA